MWCHLRSKLWSWSTEDYSWTRGVGLQLVSADPNEQNLSCHTTVQYLTVTYNILIINIFHILFESSFDLPTGSISRTSKINDWTLGTFNAPWVFFFWVQFSIFCIILFEQIITPADLQVKNKLGLMIVFWM